jgi:predicted RNase H-like HicB family nuclease
MVTPGSGSAAMRFYNFEIVIEKEPEDEGYSAYSPSLPGCFSNGRTIEEARRNMREAIQQHVASLLAHGEPVPQNERLVHVEELSIGVP